MKIPIMVLNLIIFVLVYSASINSVESRKLDETTVPATTTGTADEKCVPCGYTSPPPPANPPPSPPPPSPKKPPSQKYCPPPPSYIYITGPPGNLYPVDQDFSAASYRHHRGFAAFLLPLLVVLLGMLAF